MILCLVSLVFSVYSQMFVNIVFISNLCLSLGRAMEAWKDVIAVAVRQSRTRATRLKAARAWAAETAQSAKSLSHKELKHPIGEVHINEILKIRLEL